MKRHELYEEQGIKPSMPAPKQSAYYGLLSVKMIRPDYGC
jgi:hypothetical protein